MILRLYQVGIFKPYLPLVAPTKILKNNLNFKFIELTLSIIIFYNELK